MENRVEKGTLWKLSRCPGMEKTVNLRYGVYFAI